MCMTLVIRNGYPDSLGAFFGSRNEIDELNEVGGPGVPHPSPFVFVEKLLEVCSPATSSADCTSIKEPRWGRSSSTDITTNDPQN